MKKKILLSSVAVIALCLCLIAGSTYALFTEQTEVNIAVTAGDLEVEAAIVEESMQLRSLEDDADTYPRAGTFSNGGTVTVTDGKMQISHMTPGDAIYFEVKVVNTGDVAVMYNVKAVSAGVEQNQTDLYNALTVTVLDQSGNAFEGVNKYQALGMPGAETTFVVIVEFENGKPEDDNKYQGAVANIQFIVETVQQNGVDANGNLITD
ncbi:MAG: hypothetical protein II330_00760 [Clostridia bacterium]|nr:hypothetical protein [Clostridia bacterium]MBQ5363021.1 hypothetical protein [Clostridia bacterium]